MISPTKDGVSLGSDILSIISTFVLTLSEGSIFSEDESESLKQKTFCNILETSSPQLNSRSGIHFSLINLDLPSLSLSQFSILKSTVVFPHLDRVSLSDVVFKASILALYSTD